MMKQAALATSLSLLAGCDDLPKYPDDGLVAQIEQALAKDSCIAPIEYWRRTYYYDEHLGAARRRVRDNNRVQVDLVQRAQPLVSGGKPARKIKAPLVVSGAMPDVDSGEDLFRSLVWASADYNLRTGELRLEFCDINLAHRIGPHVVARRNAAGVLVPVS